MIALGIWGLRRLRNMQTVVENPNEDESVSPAGIEMVVVEEAPDASLAIEDTPKQKKGGTLILKDACVMTLSAC